MVEKPATSIKIFYCYSPRDKELRDELEAHLAPLKRSRWITLQLNREISAGTNWKSEIDTRLNTADIILLLVSSDFISSDYSYGVEAQQALVRHKAGEVRVIPIILRPVDWERTPLGELQPLPTNRRPVTSWPNRDEAFQDIARGIHMVADILLTQKTKEQQLATDSSTTKHSAGILPDSIDPDDIELQQLPDDLPLNPSYVIEPADDTHTYYSTQFPNKTPLVRRATRFIQEAKILPVPARRTRTHIDQKTEEEWLEEGDFHRNIGSYTDAICAYERAILLNPNNPLAYNGKGLSLYNQGRYKGALIAFDQALYLLPENISYFNKGDVLIKLKRYNEALTYLNQAIFLDPRDTNAYIYKATCLYELKQYDEAAAAWNEVIRLDPNYRTAYYKKGNALLHNYQFGKALAAYLLWLFFLLVPQ